MASLVKKYSQEKLFGQIYTPNFIICKILDDIDYNSSTILGKTIIDTACGDGHFLIEIVNRIIEFSSKKDLKNNLECVYGWDIDEKVIKELFENATTYSAITIFDKKKHKKFLYQKATKEKTFGGKYTNFSELKEPFW